MKDSYPFCRDERGDAKVVRDFSRSDVALRGRVESRGERLFAKRALPSFSAGWPTKVGDYFRGSLLVLALAMPAFSSTTLTVGELETAGAQSGSVPVVFRSDVAVADGTIFRMPLTAVDEFASFYPVVLTEFALSTARGAPVAGKIALLVRLLGLANGGRVNGSSGVTLSVEAGATDGDVTRVGYFVGGQKIGKRTSSR